MANFMEAYRGQNEWNFREHFSLRRAVDPEPLDHYLELPELGG
jgi:hypothetical protein